MVKEKGVTNISGYLNNKVTIYDNYRHILTNYEMLLDEMENYSKSIEIDPKLNICFP